MVFKGSGEGETVHRHGLEHLPGVGECPAEASLVEEIPDSQLKHGIPQTLGLGLLDLSREIIPPVDLDRVDFNPG